MAWADGVAMAYFNYPEQSMPSQLFSISLLRSILSCGLLAIDSVLGDEFASDISRVRNHEGPGNSRRNFREALSGEFVNSRIANKKIKKATERDDARCREIWGVS